MQASLKMVEKMDDLLDEAEEYVKCANVHSEDPELKSAYLDLARCHYNGYENLAKCCERVTERKMQGSEHGHAIKEMVEWHKDKFTKRAMEIKHKLDKASSTHLL